MIIKKLIWSCNLYGTPESEFPSYEVPKFPSSQVTKFPSSEAPKFPELQVPKFLELEVPVKRKVVKKQMKSLVGQLIGQTQFPTVRGSPSAARVWSFTNKVHKHDIIL